MFFTRGIFSGFICVEEKQLILDEISGADRTFQQYSAQHTRFLGNYMVDEDQMPLMQQFLYRLGSTHLDEATYSCHFFPQGTVQHHKA